VLVNVRDNEILFIKKTMHQIILCVTII
jgi:hypothetical protein